MVKKYTDNIKNDLYYTKRILKNIEVSTRYLKGKNQDDIINDGFLCDAIQNRFTRLAEDASHLSKEYKETIKSIPWDGVVSIRNRICHDYDAVENVTLYKTIKIDFPIVRKELLNKIICHYLNLQPVPFSLIMSKNKTIEMRLNDEKRKKMKTGDVIVFINNKTKEEMIAEIIDIKPYKDFVELYSNYSKSKLGYLVDEQANPDDMLIYYSKDAITKYGVLAIEIKVY